MTPHRPPADFTTCDKEMRSAKLVVTCGGLSTKVASVSVLRRTYLTVVRPPPLVETRIVPRKKLPPCASLILVVGAAPLKCTGR